MSSAPGPPSVSTATLCPGAASEPLRSVTLPSSTSPCSTAANEAAGTPSRLRSSSRAIPARSGYALWNASSSCFARAATECHASSLKIHSPSRRARRRPTSASGATVALRSARTVTPGPGRRREDSQRRVDAPGWLDGAWPSQDRPSSELVLLHSAEVCGHSISRSHRVDLLVVSLQTTYPDDATPGHDLHLVADAHRPVDERAGHDRAEAAHCEHAVDRKARPARVRPRRGFFEQCVEGVDKIRETLPARCRDPDDRGVLQRGALELRDDLGRDQLEPPLVDQVDLGQRDQAAPHVEQVK